MTEIEQSAEAMRTVSTSDTISRTYTFVTEDGKPISVSIGITAISGVSDSEWERLQDKFVKLQDSVQAIFQ